MTTKAERIAEVNKRRVEVRELMFVSEEQHALRMVEKFSSEVKASNVIVKGQRVEREKMFDQMVEQITKEEEE